MEEVLKEHFGVSSTPKVIGSGGGCISSGTSYDLGKIKLFVKSNSKQGSDVMFNGEMESLRALLKTNTVKVPEPYFAQKTTNGEQILVVEHLDMSSLRSYQGKLGENFAKLHLHNINLLQQSKQNETRIAGTTLDAVKEFGFHTPTCCGFIPLDNTWATDWVTFYSRQRLENKVEMITKEHGDRKLIELWSQLQLKIDSFFKDIQVQPCLLHGDLWSGNAAQTADEPVIFDPASFYGHYEFDLAITKMFGGFSASFYKSYFSTLPKEKGFDKRQQLYLLFHYLNHWNHFGGGYKSSSLSIMSDLVKS